MAVKALKGLINPSSFSDPRVPETKLRVLEAALSIIMETGIQSLTLAELARKSRLSKPRIAYHYKTMDDVVLELFSYMAKLGQETTRIALENLYSPEEKLVAIFEATQTWMRIHPEFGKFFAVIYSYASTSPKVLKVHTQVLSTGLQRIEGMLTDLKMDPMRAQRTAMQIQNLMIGTAFRSISLRSYSGKKRIGATAEDTADKEMIKIAIQTLCKN